MYQSKVIASVIISVLLAFPVLAQTKKFKDIAPKAAPPDLTDQVLGVTGGTTDNLYTLQQLQIAIGLGILKVTPYSGLPAVPTLGMLALVKDGLAIHCGDTTCTTWGTTVTGGGGALNLVVWYNGVNWIVMGATAANTPIVCNNAFDFSEACNTQYLTLGVL